MLEGRICSNTCISRGAGANESNTSKYMYLCIFRRIHDVLVMMTEYMLKCIVNTLIRYQILMSPPLQLSTTLIHRNTLLIHVNTCISRNTHKYTQIHVNTVLEGTPPLWRENPPYRNTLLIHVNTCISRNTRKIHTNTR